MIDFDQYAGKALNIVCKDGTVYENYRIYGISSAEDNYDPGYAPLEQSIDILPLEGEPNGVGLFESEIESIEVIS